MVVCAQTGSTAREPARIREIRRFMVVVGGVIPPQDYDGLYRDGAAAIFGPGTRISVSVIKMIELLNAKRA